MKINFSLTAGSFFCLAIAGLVQAETSAPTPRKVHPCKVVHEACVAAGFAPGKSKEGKGLVKNCVQPLMENQPVAGVSVDPEALASCREKRKSLKKVRKNKGKRRHGKPATTGLELDPAPEAASAPPDAAPVSGQ